MNRYPLYVVSKGRYARHLRDTVRYLERMGLPHHLVVEQEEEAEYRAVLTDLTTLHVLDQAYKRSYDLLDTLGEAKSTGPGPARNYVWDHAASVGAERHWVVDDNIAGFYRYNRNRKVLALTHVFFDPMEDWVDRYVNVAMAGPHYEHFVIRDAKHPPYILNTRVYSCNLILTSAPFRWRGRYNEDTILSLDMLKAGWCTALFVAFLQNKTATQRMEGGNTDAFYVHEGTLPKSQMLVRTHPDVARLVHRWGRWHHHVDYRRFRHNRLERVPGATIPAGVHDYGMALVPVSSRAGGG